MGSSTARLKHNSDPILYSLLEDMKEKINLKLNVDAENLILVYYIVKIAEGTTDGNLA